MPKDSILLNGNEDLNTVVEEGEYYWGWWNETIINAPVHSAFHLSVKRISAAEVSQTYTQYTGGYNVIYTRQSNNNKTSWSDWSMCYTTSNKPTAADVGAAPSGHDHNGMVINPSGIELTTQDGWGHGGAIDFHFNGDTSDYTSRIMEVEKGKLFILGGLNVTGGIDGYFSTSSVIPVGNGGTGETTYQKAMAALSKPQTGDWRTAEPGISAWYYEGGSATFGTPAECCYVLVIKGGANRGTAIAFGWANHEFMIWRSVLHDDTHSNNWSYWVDAGTAIGARPDTWLPSAAEVGALSNDGYPSYSTVLDACNNISSAGGTFFAVSGHSLAGAADSAFPGLEVQYLVLADHSGGARKTVIANRYGHPELKIRNIWNGNWQTEWILFYGAHNKPSAADVGAKESGAVEGIETGGTGANDLWGALANLGLASFRTYYFDNCNSPLLTLQNNYGSIDNVACIIYCYCNGARYVLVGYKVDNYAAFLEVSYAGSSMTKYRNANGTWSQHTYNSV